VGEVSRLAVDVDVLRIETRTTLGEGLGEHGADLAEKPAHGLRRQSVGRGLGVDTSGPQRLVGVDVADAADDRLVEENPFDRAAARKITSSKNGSIGSRAMCSTCDGTALEPSATRASTASDPNVRWSANTTASSPCVGCSMCSRMRS
jgi:hypothetical protein